MSMGVEAVERIAAAGSLNLVWGAPSASQSGSIGWPVICLAELWRLGRIARLLTANSDNGAASSAFFADLFPSFHENEFPDFTQTASPCIYQLDKGDPAALAGLIAHGAQTGTWLVIGSNTSIFKFADGLKNIPRFEHGLYWVGHFDNEAPAPLGREFFSAERNAHFVTGFDAPSFLAYLVRKLSDFPPALATGAKGLPYCAGTAKPTPMQQLHRWCSSVNDQFRQRSNGMPERARDLLQKAADIRGEDYAPLAEQAIQIWQMYLRITPTPGFVVTSLMVVVAGKRAPQEAEVLLRKCLKWIQKYPASSGMESFTAGKLAEVIALLAKFRTGAAADALYSAAEQILLNAPSSPGTADSHAASRGELLCQWADRERGPNSSAIFERARSAYQEAQRIKYSADRQFRFAQALHLRATALEGEAAARMYAGAREAIEPLLAVKPKDAGLLQFRGVLAGSQGRSAEAESCMREAIALYPAHAADLLMSWATSLGTGGKFEEAEPVFRESEAIRPDSRALRKNWSSILIRRARANRGTPELWDRAREQAQKAEAIDAGSGAYNLACIAAELDDREGVERCMKRSAEYGQIMGLSHILRDESFAEIRNEGWFRALLTHIFPSDE